MAKYKNILLVIIIICITLISCSSNEGWGVVLWPPENSALAYGDIVPIYFKSNITRTYAVGVEKLKTKEELELWRIEYFSSKSKAKNAVASYKSTIDLMAITQRDGLVLRAAPENTAQQVYKLKFGEAIRLLEETSGAEVKNATQSLEGKWYKALSSDGTQGYIFSNQLVIWHALSESTPDIKSTGLQANTGITTLYTTTWRPEYFSTMTETGYIDLTQYQAKFGLFIDEQKRIMRLERPDFSKVYRYNSITAKDNGYFIIEPYTTSFYFSKNGSLLLLPSKEDLNEEAINKLSAQEGSVIQFEFIPYDVDVTEVINKELRRQMVKLSDFVYYGDSYKGVDGSVLQITKTGRFTWNDYSNINVIPEGSGAIGSIAMDVHIPQSLEHIWDGAFTLRFENGVKPSLTFAYRREADKLLLTYISSEHINMGVILDTSVNIQSPLEFWLDK